MAAQCQPDWESFSLSSELEYRSWCFLPQRAYLQPTKQSYNNNLQFYNVTLKFCLTNPFTVDPESPEFLPATASCPKEQTEVSRG